MNPLVSVIVSVKNGEKFIGEALTSILEQSYAPFEILVIDGASIDQTVKIVCSFSKVRCLKQEDKGIAAANNQGIKAAKGDLVAFLSHDDLWHREKLKKQVDFLKTYPTMDYVVCRAKFFLENPAHIPSGFRADLLEGDHLASVMETLLVRRTLFEKVGFFNQELAVAEDVDWFSRARDCGIMSGSIKEVLLYKRVHEQNSSLCHGGMNQTLLQAIRSSVQRKKNPSKIGAAHGND